MLVGLGGLGVAAFHPEGARYANYASGSRRGTGMSLFSVGGNTGFALAPVLITPAVLAVGLEGTLLVAILPALVAIMLAFELPHLKRRSAAAAKAVAAGQTDRTDDQWGAFGTLTGVVSIRSGVYFGLQSFAPLWLITTYGASEATGNTALAGMLFAGALGTLVGGRLVDRIGRRKVLVGSIVAQIPLLLGFMLAPGGVLAGILLAGIGFVTVMSFSVSVVMGQEYLPSRLGIASGVTLGFAIGVGGVFAALFGVVADHAGLETVMWIVAALPLAGLALALTLPLTAQEARLDTLRAERAQRHRCDSQNRPIAAAADPAEACASFDHSKRRDPEQRREDDGDDQRLAELDADVEADQRADDRRAAGERHRTREAEPVEESEQRRRR